MPEQKSETARWAQVAATVFLGVVGLIFTVIQNNQQEDNRKAQFLLQQVNQKAQIQLQEQNRKAQLGLQLMSQRELSEMDFRQKMFEVLVNKLLDPKVDVRERVTRLQLFQHNFHDIFNGRALFNRLEKEALKLPKREDRDETIHNLVSLAKEITRDQELLVGAKPTEIKDIIVGNSTIVNLKSDHDSHEPSEEQAPSEEPENSHEHSEEPENSHKIKIKLIKVRARSVEVQVTINHDTAEARTIQFDVSYFDAPLTDNTLLPDKHRFAITLKDTNINKHPYKATLNVFEFPADFVTTGYRPMITEANKLIEGIQ